MQATNSGISKSKTRRIFLRCEESNGFKGRSRYRRCSIKKPVLKNFSIFTGKHVLGLFLIKFKAWRVKETATQVFFCEFCEIFKNSFFEEHLRTAASINARCQMFNTEKIPFESYNLYCACFIHVFLSNKYFLATPWVTRKPFMKSRKFLIKFLQIPKGVRKIY